MTRPAPPPAPALPPAEALAPVAAAPEALVLSGGWQIEGLPATIRRAGPQAAERTVEFFTAQIRNPHTRAAYGTAVTRFFTWCDARGLELEQISPIAVATYIEEMHGRYRAPTIKQHLAAIRRLFDWLVIGQVVPTNPATSVRGPTHVVKTGKTPVLQPAEARQLLDTIDTATLRGLRDRALLAVMVYSFARVSAVVNMRVEDYYQQGKRWWLRLQEKGGKHHAVPVHHKAEAYLDAYLDAAGIAAERDAPLWRSMPRAGGMGARRMSRVDLFRMIKRRVKAVGLGEANCHTFRATGITAYLLKVDRECYHAHAGMGAWMGQHLGGVHACLTTAGVARRDEHPRAVGLVTQPHPSESPPVRECARRRSWRPRSRRTRRTGHSR